MSFFISLVSEPMNYPFMQRAMIAAIITGSVCAILSCYLVLKSLGAVIKRFYLGQFSWPSYRMTLRNPA